MTVREIQGHVASTVSRSRPMSSAWLPMESWMRPASGLLDPIYPVVFLDALRFKSAMRA
jgi:hypothetical protein